MCSARVSFQNLLGIILLLGKMDSNFLGETGLDSPGEVLNCIGEVTPMNVWYTAGEQSLDQNCRGTIFRPKLSGMLVKNIHAAGEC